MSALRLVALSAVILLIAVLPVGSAAVHAQEAVVGEPAAAPPEPAAAPVVDPFSFLPDPKDWAADVFEEVIASFCRAFAEVLRSVIRAVLGSSLNFVSQTPAAGSYASPTVRALWDVVRGVANAGLVLVVLWGGINLVVRDHVRAPYHDAMELFPRLALGAVMVNLSLVVGQMAIELNNALCAAVGGAALPAWENASAAKQLWVEEFAALVYLLAGLVLVLQMLMRLALVDALLVVAPLAMLCWVLPQTQGWTRLWSSTFLSAVFVQFLQVLTLTLGTSLLTEITPMAVDAAFLSLFLGVAVIVLTLKVPGLVHVHAGGGLGFVRYVAYRRGAQALENSKGPGGRQ